MTKLKLQYFSELLSLDHQDGMRGRVECHQHSSDMKSHVSE